MKLTPSERLGVEKAIRQGDNLWSEQCKNPRARFIGAVTVVETLVGHIAENHGRRQTWEWLHRMADELLKDDLQ